MVQSPGQTTGGYRLMVQRTPYQGTVLHIFSEQAVVIQCVLGFASHTVHGALVHLMLNPSEEHIQRLSYRVLRKCGQSGPLAGGKHTRDMFGWVMSLLWHRWAS